MGAILKFLIFLFGIFFLLTIIIGAKTMQKIVQFLLNGSNAFQKKQSRSQKTQEPHTQEDRIIDYQKKSFESSKIEDVEFEEVKDAKNSGK